MKRLKVDLDHHNQIIEKIMCFEHMPELEKDPLEDQEADYNVDLTKFADYELKSHGTFINPQKDKVKIS